MKKYQKNKIIFIDWNGTLSPSNFWCHLEKSKKESDRKLFKIWAGSMFVTHREKIVPWMKGAYTTEEMLQFVADDTKSNYKELRNEFIKGCKKMEYSSGEIPKLIKKLRARDVMVNIATNNMDSFTRWTVRAMSLDILFDEILNSFDLKVMKHELDATRKPLFFFDFFKKYSIDPRRSECIFIDDGEDKLGTISSLGINYRRINTENTLEKELLKILNTI